MLQTNLRNLVATGLSAACLCLASAGLATPTTASEPAGPRGPAKLQLHRPADLETTTRGRFLVAFDAEASRSAEIADELRRQYDLELLGTWHRALAGAVIECELAVAEQLSLDPRIRFVEQDVAIERRPRRVASVTPRQGKGATGPPSCFADDGSFRLNPYPGGSSAISWGPQCPGDASCSGNWGLDRIDDRDGLDGTYQPTTGTTPVHVFAIDSGVALDHAELDTVPTDEVVLASANAAPFFHGTHVAGIAVGKNAGVARGPIRFTSLNLGSNSDHVLFTSWIIEGFETVLERRKPGTPAVVTMSLNSSAFPSSRILAQVVRRVVAEKVVVVNSAGNLAWETKAPVTCADTQNIGERTEEFSLSGTLYPQEVLIAGASADNDQLYCECGELDEPRYDCATRIGDVDLFAPGVDIVSMSTVDDQALCRLSGSSMAAPHVAGAAALLLSRFPEASPDAIERALVRMSTKNRLVDPINGTVERNRLLYVGPYNSNRPVAGSQYVYAQAGETLVIAKSDLIADDFDWQGRNLQVTQVYGASSGSTLVDQGSTVAFTVNPSAPPSRNHYQSAYFRYTISNGLQTDSAVLRVVVLAEPTDDTVVFGGAGAVDIDLATLLANDNLNADEVRCLTPRTTTTTGSVTLRQLGGECVGYRYQPPHGQFRGTDSFDYVVALRSGGEATGRVVVHYNDPARPTPITGPALADHPDHGSQSAVQVPTGAYLIAWPTSDHTAVQDYELRETDRGTGQTTVLYRGPRTFHAVSGRSNGSRDYTVRACTAVACSEPSPITGGGVGFGGSPFSIVNTTLEACQWPVQCNPRRGLWYDPSRPGNGIDLQIDSAGRWRIVFFTYRQSDSTPIWYRATPARFSGSTLVAVLEEVRSQNGVLGTAVDSEPFGFLEIDFMSTTSSMLRVYRFDDPSPGEHGYENLLFTGNFQYLAGAAGGADGQWRPNNGASWGLALTSMPLASDGSTTAFSTTYFFRPDGSPTWVSTFMGTRIPSPFLQYRGWIRPLFRRGLGLCLECSGGWSWQDTVLGYTIYVDIPNARGATGTGNLSVAIPQGADPAFFGGYTFSYQGGLTKVTR